MNDVYILIYILTYILVLVKEGLEKFMIAGNSVGPFHISVVEIESGRINGGTMSNRALALIQEWRKPNKEALLRDWKLAEQKKALFPIKPLE
jgi:hypothetical protein